MNHLTTKERLERLERITDRLEKTLMALHWKARNGIVMRYDDFSLSKLSPEVEE